MKAIVIMLTAIAACDPQTWYRAQVGLEASAVAGLACDGGSTHEFLEHSSYVEVNPVLGERPSNAALAAYLGGVGVALVLVDHLLLDRYAPTWGPRIASVLAAGVSAVEWESVGHNMTIGSSFCGMGHGGPWATPSETSARRM